MGSHTWSHANLNKKSMTEQRAKDEIAKGFSAVRLALGAAPAPFFRFPQLQHALVMVTYLGTRDIAMFSCDLDPFDFKATKPERIVETVIATLLSKRRSPNAACPNVTGSCVVSWTTRAVHERAGY
jgi:peptidoglycan/xylan/chitin deacetylase (PgdA/CDA1 family)